MHGHDRSDGKVHDREMGHPRFGVIGMRCGECIMNDQHPSFHHFSVHTSGTPTRYYLY